MLSYPYEGLLPLALAQALSPDPRQAQAVRELASQARAAFAQDGPRPQRRRAEAEALLVKLR